MKEIQISLDGSTGNIYDGIIPTVDATIAGEFGESWDGLINIEH